MPNVMDGVRRMEKDQLSSQLASLKTVTMANVYSEMGQKASKGTVKAFNGIRRLFNAAPVKEPEVISLDERIANCKAELDYKGKDELVSEMRSTLVQKINALSIGALLSDNTSDDELSICVIDAACKNFKKQINDDLSPAQKADAVYQRYNERLLAQTKEKYDKATDAEKKEINAQMQKEIDSMSVEQREELRKALGVEKVTGETLTKLISTSAGASALLIALNASGFGAFMALTSIMHAVFTTMLGITLPFVAYTTSTSILSFFLGPAGWIIFAGAEIFMLNGNKNKLIYELMSQIVWSSVLTCDGHFAPRDESLPSWLPYDQRMAAISDNKEFMKLQREFEALLNQFDRQSEQIKQMDEIHSRKESEIITLKNKIRSQEEMTELAEKEKIQFEASLQKAKAEYEKYRKYADSENESLRQQYSEAQLQVDRAEFDVKRKAEEIVRLEKSNQESIDMIDLYEKELEKAGEEKNKLLMENSSMKSAMEKTKTKLENAELKESKKLRSRWEITFKKFQFDPGVIKYVVKNYEFNEYGDIERRLMELHEAKDPAALQSNRGKMAGSGELHLEVSTPTGFPSRIFYKPLKNVVGKTVEITNILKHNDPRYGKY